MLLHYLLLLKEFFPLRTIRNITILQDIQILREIYLFFAKYTYQKYFIIPNPILKIEFSQKKAAGLS